MTLMTPEFEKYIYTIVHRVESGETFYDETICDNLTKTECLTILSLTRDLYQYYVAEEDQEGNILRTENADEWVEIARRKETIIRKLEGK